MIPGLKRELESAVAEACRRIFGTEAPGIVLETPPKVELGDLACPVAFELAKVLKRSPRKIAEELAPALTLPALAWGLPAKRAGTLRSLPLPLTRCRYFLQCAFSSGLRKPPMKDARAPEKPTPSGRP